MNDKRKLRTETNKHHHKMNTTSGRRRRRCTKVNSVAAGTMKKYRTSRRRQRPREDCQSRCSRGTRKNLRRRFDRNRRRRWGTVSSTVDDVRAHVVITGTGRVIPSIMLTDARAIHGPIHPFTARRFISKC